MSDFGARIYINKKSAEAFTEKEVEEIAALCEGLKKETRLTNSLGDPYLFHVGKTINLDHDHCYEVNVLLSNHWGNQSQFKWHKEIDAKDMKVIASSLRQLLPKEYKVKAKFEWW